MQSLRELFRIGKGPSSSHTIGPEHASMLSGIQVSGMGFGVKYPKMQSRSIYHLGAGHFNT